MVSPPPPKNPNYLSTYYFCLLVLVSTTTFSAAVSSSSYSSACPSVTPASDRPTDSSDALSLVRFFQIFNSYFPGSADSLFSPDDKLHSSYRWFYLQPDSVSRTSDPVLVHLRATLTLILTGSHSSKYLSHGRRGNNTFTKSISFVLDGYYSSTSLQLCMVGTGTEPAANGSSVKHYADVALRLHIPSPSTLTDPFVTGTLDGSSDFGAIQLLAYPDDDDYKYGEPATCSPPLQPTMGSLRTLFVNFACEYLQNQLINSYRLLDHHGGASAKIRRMLINRMQCTADSVVRAYMVFSNDTGSGRPPPPGYVQYNHLMVNEEAVIADGQWDSARNMLCLRGCRVVRSALSILAVSECGIGMSFWFPAAWTILERSEVAGVLWNSGNVDAGPISGVVSAFSFDDQRWNLSGVKYSYNDTMLQVAREHYLKKIDKEKIKGGSFPVPADYLDFSLRFFMKNAWTGEACPVTIGSMMLTGDGLPANDSPSARPTAVDGLVSISYDIHHYAPPPEKQGNVSRSNTLEEGRISAEGVYDPERGILSMAGCQEHSGSTDCQILITVQFAASGDDRAHGLGSRGVISSLRDRTDRLFFEKMEITLYEMYPIQPSEAISRMDLESVMLVASATLSCAFAVLQILHTKRRPEKAPAMSITMLAVLAMGQLAPLVLSFEVLFLSRRSQYLTYSTEGRWLELNQAMMRVPGLIAFLLHLRLLQLASFSRLRSPDTATPSTAASERIVLQVCMPLYLLGGVLATIFHVINARAAAASGGTLAIHTSGEPATLWDDLVSYAGMILDGFLLPQIILNASMSGSIARAISPWFYMGGTMLRVAPHVYDVVRGRINEVLRVKLTQVYASPRGDLFDVAWDIIITCGAASLATLLFLQQRTGNSSLLPSQRRRACSAYEMVP